jgi:hypothetical protein
VLVVVAAHLLTQGGLVQYQFLHSVCEKAALSVHAVPALRKAATQLQLSLRARLRQAFVANLAHQTYNYYSPCSVSIRTRANRTFLTPSLCLLPDEGTCLARRWRFFKNEGVSLLEFIQENKTYFLFQK